MGLSGLEVQGRYIKVLTEQAIALRLSPVHTPKRWIFGELRTTFTTQQASCS